ncbi:MAG: hypothetical protein AAGA25_10330 [Planctomycetota bacterium]
MKIQSLSIAFLLAGLMVGCEEAKDAAAEATDAAKDAAEVTSDKTGDALESLKDDAAAAGKEISEAGSDAYEAGKKEVEEALDAGKEKLNELNGSGESAAGGITLDSFTEGMSLNSDQLDGIIAQVKGLIGEKNYDTASQWISKLEGLELPDGYAEQIENLKSLLDNSQGVSDLLKGIGG